MGEANLKEEELEAIGEYVKSHLNDWLGQGNVIPFTRQLDMVERITSVEGEIKNINEQLKLQLHLMDKRFEQMDKRFEDLRQDMNARFEQVDSRFKQMFAYITTTFVLLAALMSLYQFLG